MVHSRRRQGFAETHRVNETFLRAGIELLLLLVVPRRFQCPRGLSAGLPPLAWWYCGFESCRGMNVSLMRFGLLRLLHHGKNKVLPQCEQLIELLIRHP